MQIEFKEQGNNEATLTLTIEPSDYTDKIKSGLQRLQQTHSLPGFRKGKTPLGLLRKRFEESIRFEELRNLIVENVTKFHRENSEKILFQPISDPNDSLETWKNERFQTNYIIGLKPEVHFDTSQSIPIDYPKIILTEEEINAAILRYRKSIGETTEMESVTDEPNLSFTLELNELDDDGLLLEGGYSCKIPISWDNASDDLKKLCLGKKAFEKEKLTLREHLTDETILKLFDIHESGLEDMLSNFSLEISNIQQTIPVDDNEKVLSIFYNENPENKTFDDFKEEVKQGLDKEYDQYVVQPVISEFEQYLMDNIQLELPLAFLKIWFKNSREENNNYEPIEDKDFEAFLEAVKHSVIIDHFLKKYEITVTDSDIEAFYVHHLIQQSGMDFRSLDAQMIQSLGNLIHQNEQLKLKLQTTLENSKSIESLFKDCKLNIVEMTYEEYKSSKETKNESVEEVEYTEATEENIIE